MKLGFLGMGKMADAILAGALNSQLVTPTDVTACEKVPERAKTIAQLRGIALAPDPLTLLKKSRVVILAVKPQDLEALLKQIKPDIKPSHLIVSIAAGKKLAWLQKQLGAQTRIVRVMPNLPLTVGQGMSAYAPGKTATLADVRTVAKILKAAGAAVQLPESQFDAVTALSGSGPAFYTWCARAMIKAGVAAGLDSTAAPLLALQTMLGTAKVLLEGNITPDDFIRAVSSPHGTTVAGTDVLAASDSDAVLAKTIQAAADRSAELGK